MANSKQAKKRIRQADKQTALNRSRRSRMRSYVRKVEEAIVGGDQTVAQAALIDVQPEIMRAAKGGLLHKKNAARKVSRLARRVNAMQIQAA